MASSDVKDKPEKPSPMDVDSDEDAPKKAKHDMEPREKLAAAKGKHERGNACFRTNDIERAIRRYKSALDYISFDMEFGSSDARRAKEQREVCYSNLALCYLKGKKFYEARRECDKALEINPRSVKALFRRGSANVQVGEYGQARKDFKSLLVLEPDDKRTLRELDRLDALEARQKKKEAKVYKRVLQNMDGLFSSDRNTQGTSSSWYSMFFGEAYEKYAAYTEHICASVGSVCCLLHAIGFFRGGSWLSSFLLGSSLVFGGTRHVRMADSLERYLPPWLPYRKLWIQVFAGLELFFGMAFLTSSSAQDRRLIGKSLAIVSLFVILPITSRLRSLSYVELLEFIQSNALCRKFVYAFVLGLWGLALNISA